MEKSAKRERILLCLCNMSGREEEFVAEAFRDNWIVPLGPNVTGFESDLQNFFGINRPVVALSSGTAAIHIALDMLGVEPGDEVMVQSFTFCASSNPIIYLGATPVFVDSEPDTWNMDPELLDKAISDRLEKTGRLPKAIVPVYLYGMPAKIDEIMAVADKWGIPVMEDAAEALGSKYNGRYCGLFGRYGALSFNGNKMITTSGGGALICPDEEAGKRALYLATQARQPYPFYQHVDVGYNYRLSNVSAGIGRGQMTILQRHIEHHHHVQQLYRELLGNDPRIHLHDNPSDKFDSNFWLCAITLAEGVHVKGEEDVSLPEDIIAPDKCVEALRMALDKANIESRPLWKPMHLQPVDEKYPSYVNGVSESLFRRGLCLPAGPKVTDEDVKYIADTILNTLEQ